MSRSGNNYIRPAESSAPQKAVDSSTSGYPPGSYLPGEHSPVIGKRAADTSLKALRYFSATLY
jgi:hypothetical protein